MIAAASLVLFAPNAPAENATPKAVPADAETGGLFACHLEPEPELLTIARAVTELVPEEAAPDLPLEGEEPSVAIELEVPLIVATPLTIETPPPLPSTPLAEGMRQSLTPAPVPGEPTPVFDENAQTEIVTLKPSHPGVPTPQPALVPPAAPPQVTAPEIPLPQAPVPQMSAAANDSSPPEIALPPLEPQVTHPSSERAPAPPAPQPVPEDAQPAGLTPTKFEPLRQAADAPAPAPAPAPIPAPPAPRQTPPLLRNVLDRLSEVEIAEGKTRLLLRPKGMGVLEIDVARQIDGRLHLLIRAENPLLLDALRRESGAMSDFLGTRGFDLSGGEPELSRYTPPEPETEAEVSAVSEEPQDPDSPQSGPLLDGARLDLVT